MTTMRSARSTTTTLLSFLTTVSAGHSSSRLVGGGCGGGGVFGGFISSPLKTTTATTITTRSSCTTNTARTAGWFQRTTKLFGTTASGGGTGDSYGFCNIKPMFKVTDWNKMKPIMAEFVEKTKSEKGCVYYGWVKSGDDDLICREAYKDGQAILDHLDNVGDLLSKALDDVKCASLESLAIMGPAEQLDVVKPATADFGTEYYAVAGKGGFTNMEYSTVEEDTPYSLCCIEPLFTVNDWDKAKPLMDEFEDAARTEPGCLFYGWVANDNNKLICREAYVDGAATVAHIDNVGALLGEGLEGDSPALTLESINLQLPSDQLSTVKPVFDDFGTIYYEADSGFGRYKKV